MDIVYNVTFVTLGYLFFSYSSADKTGGENKLDKLISETLNYEIKTSLRVEYDEIIIHLHHWILCYLGFILLQYTKNTNVSYLCLGGMIQGILNYSDWKNIITLKDGY